MTENGEEQNGGTGQIFIEAQIDFCETILSLDQLLTTSRLALIESVDSVQRGKSVMDALKTRDNGEVLKTWETASDRAYKVAMALEDDSQREAALDEWSKERRDGLAGIIKNAVESGHPIDARIDLVVRQVKARPRPIDLIRQAVLVTLISAFEGVIGKTYRAALTAKPELYMSAEKQYSLLDIVKVGALEPIIEATIEKKVDGALRGGLEDWEKLFIKLDTHFKKLCIDWGKTEEVFQRRNALIHTHGTVNATYASKVKGAQPLGTPLQIDEEYLRQAINQIAALGNLVILRSWLHLFPQQNFLATGLPYLYLDNFIERGYWSAVGKIADEMKSVKNDFDVKIRCRLYAWLARKNVHGVESIRSELEEWDTSALKSEFAFCKAILLDDLVSAGEIKEQAAARSEPWVAECSEMAVVKYRQTGEGRT
ncbi:hypothetical protein ACWDO7_19380 [Streptomyces sp. NPDC003656]